MNKNSIKEFVVVNAGVVDVEASVAKFETALVAHVENRGTALEVAEEAVLGVLAEYPGKRLTREFLTTKALMALNAQPSNSGSLTKLIGEFLKTSPLLDSKKGSGGGTMIASEVPANETK